jgi:hypothetical protein
MFQPINLLQKSAFIPSHCMGSMIPSLSYLQKQIMHEKLGAKKHISVRKAPMIKVPIQFANI